MKKEEVKTLFQNERFLATLNKVDSMEELQRLLSDNGVEMSITEMENAIKNGTNTELTEDELRNIFGGVIFKWRKFAWDCVMFNPLDVY